MKNKIILYRQAVISDVPKIKSLWEEVFGDENDYIHHFIVHFGYENCYVCEKEQEIVSIAFALPTTLSPSNIEEVPEGQDSLYFKYIYACATHPIHQSQGIMQNLLNTIYNDACNENIAGIFLHAADTFLADYYQKLGFTDFLYRKHWYYNRKEYANNPLRKSLRFLRLNIIPPEEYYKKRIQKLENTCFINWNEDFFKFLQKNEMQFYEYESSIFSFKTLFNMIIVDELLGNTPPEQIAQLLIKQFPECKTVNVRLPGNEICCGQVKWCKHWENKPETGYFAFAME